MPNPATPTAIRIAQGNPAHRPLNDHEPQAIAGAPDLPIDLSERARAFWHALVPILLQLGTLTTADGAGLEMLCQALELKAMAYESIQRDGIVIESSQGKKSNPAVNIYDKSQKQVRALLGQFGLTPSARAQLKSTNPELASPLEKLLAERTRIRNGIV